MIKADATLRAIQEDSEMIPDVPIKNHVLQLCEQYKEKLARIWRCNIEIGNRYIVCAKIEALQIYAAHHYAVRI